MIGILVHPGLFWGVMTSVDQIRMKYELLRPVMDERMTRFWAAAEAKVLGYGGIAAVTAATGILAKRIIAGTRDLQKLQKKPTEKVARVQRVRRPGGGRKPLESHDPQLVGALEALIEPTARGDPESSLRWTTKSTRKLAQELTKQGHPVGPTKIRHLLKRLGYSLQATRKTREGAQHPERNAQFEFIYRKVKTFQTKGLPVISVDTKKKELVGDFKIAGREWHPKGEPVSVRVHDFIDQDLGKAVPYGVYDILRNEGWVSVGVNHDTAEFAVESIRRWWKKMGRLAYPSATDLLITADAGGSNGTRPRLWKTMLQNFADDSGLRLHVCHYPPGTSKWNKIEHRMFCHITQNWRGRPLESVEAVVNLIGSTTTSTGLRVCAGVDTNTYDKGIKIPDDELSTVNLKPSRVRGAWNYSIEPHT